MAAYVDPIQHYPGARWRIKYWCHLTADTREELHAMAARIGRRRESFQEHPYRWHYDLTPVERAAAVDFGAREVTTRELVRTMRARMPPAETSPSARPEQAQHTGRVGGDVAGDA